MQREFRHRAFLQKRLGRYAGVDGDGSVWAEGYAVREGGAAAGDRVG